MATNSKEYMAAWRAKNREKYNAYLVEWTKRHPGYKLKYRPGTAKWRSENAAWLAEYSKEYRRKNPTWNAANCNRRRARKLSQTPLNFDDVALYAALRARGYCSYCLKTEAPERLQIDHIVPLAKGGLHAPENLTQACKSCNCRKRTKTGYTPRTLELR